MFSTNTKNTKEFQPSKGSAFNYFTTVIVNNLKLLYTKNKKYEKKISEYQDLKNNQNPNSLIDHRKIILGFNRATLELHKVGNLLGLKDNKGVGHRKAVDNIEGLPTLDVLLSEKLN